MPSPPSVAGSSRARAASLILSVGAALASTWALLSHGWVGFDEGLIGLSAQQVLRGALPHADFAYPYTGALPWYHALAMRAFGVHLMAPRYALFAAFAAWLPTVWWLAARQAGAVAAAAVTLLAAFWSLTVYPAAMPTWYLLFLATWIVAALERHGAMRRLRWIVLAGVLAGTAVAIKQTGLFLVAGAMLGVLFDDQSRRRAERGGGSPAEHAARAGRTDVGVLAAIVALAAIVVRLLASRLLASGEFVVLFVPVAAVLGAAALRERHLTANRAARWRTLLTRQFALLAGVAVPLLAFAAPYVARGAAAGMWADVVSGGLSRLQSLQVVMPGAWELLSHAWLVLLAVAVELCYGERRGAKGIAAALAVVAVWLSSRGHANYLRVWDSAVLTLPFAVVAAVVVTRFAASRADGAPAATAARTDDAPLLTLAAMTAFHGLHQFPYSEPNYVAYVVPLAFLTVAYAAARLRLQSRLVFAAGTFLLFGGVMNRIGAVQTVGVDPIWWDDAHALPPRGRLHVTALDSASYLRLEQLVAAHRGSGLLYAGPELPEVYFLTASPLPGHDPFEFIPRGLTDSSAVAAFVDTTRATMVVLKPTPMFLPRTPPAIHAWLAGRFPHAERVDTLFEVRWR